MYKTDVLEPKSEKKKNTSKIWGRRQTFFGKVFLPIDFLIYSLLWSSNPQAFTTSPTITLQGYLHTIFLCVRLKVCMSRCRYRCYCQNFAREPRWSICICIHVGHRGNQSSVDRHSFIILGAEFGYGYRYRIYVWELRMQFSGLGWHFLQ